MDINPHSLSGNDKYHAELGLTTSRELPDWSALAEQWSYRHLCPLILTDILTTNSQPASSTVPTILRNHGVLRRISSF
jgi:hypothetical protein